MSKRYKVKVDETVSYEMAVEADTLHEAEALAMRALLGDGKKKGAIRLEWKHDANIRVDVTDRCIMTYESQTDMRPLRGDML